MSEYSSDGPGTPGWTVRVPLANEDYAVVGWVPRASAGRSRRAALNTGKMYFIVLKSKAWLPPKTRLMQDCPSAIVVELS
jgi:hypothetical protein